MPRVGETQVGEEDAVDALRARQVPVAVGLGLGVVADDLQQQRLAGAASSISTPAMNAGKNGSALSSCRVAGDDEAQCERTTAAQRAR